ncbi:large ribosomal subunit protein bL33m isoform X1 [Canis aureus]
MGAWPRAAPDVLFRDKLPRASQRKKKLENSNAAFAYNPRHITDHKTRYFGLKLMKNITILVKMLSQAGTGYSFNTKRSRLREKLTLLHYDPIDRFLSGKETSHVKSIADTVLETKKRVSSERKELFSWDHLTVASS